MADVAKVLYIVCFRHIFNFSSGTLKYMILEPFGQPFGYHFGLIWVPGGSLRLPMEPQRVCFEPLFAALVFRIDFH